VGYDNIDMGHLVTLDVRPRLDGVVQLVETEPGGRGVQQAVPDVLGHHVI
jgi:hypothetical protein